MTVTHMMLLFASIGFAGADLPVRPVLYGNPNATKTECQSWWCPTLLETGNATLLFGCCKTAERGLVTSALIQSHDAGQTWGNQIPISDLGQPVYSRSTSEIIMIVAYDGKTAAHTARDQENQLSSPNYMDSPDPSPAWAKDLTPLSPADLAKCQTAVVRSKDDGLTWSEPEVIRVNNSLGPAYTGFALNHGVEVKRGPYAGRLALARRFDCPAAMGDHGRPEYFRSFALYSDDHGASWEVGQLLPQGWTECQLSEMRNGSLLLTSRLYGSPWYQTNATLDRHRGFARSDDGGHTWAEIWYIRDRQPEIENLETGCSEALVSDTEGDGIQYWGHPGDGLSRHNYTLHRSMDDGASWEFVNRVYAGGAGYSDAHVLHSTSGSVLAMAFQKTFDPPRKNIEGGGYDMGLVLLPLTEQDVVGELALHI